MVSYIIWDVDPTIFELEIFGYELPIRWYGFLFALGFLVGQQILYYIYRKDSRPSHDVDSLTIYVVVGTIVGARFGHFLFYEWELLFDEPLTWLLNLITPPFAGLASHGATIGILISLYLYSRRKADQPFLWLVDRVVIVVSLGGAFIRLGNLMNSEIYGDRTSLPWAFVFQRETDAELLPLGPRHPTQLYEAMVCLALFILTFSLWKRKRSEIPAGIITSFFIIVLFASRFLIEFLKNSQKAFENDLILNMGQLLSIPAVIVGFVIMLIALKSKEKPFPKF